MQTYKFTNRWNSKLRSFTSRYNFKQINKSRRFFPTENAKEHFEKIKIKT